jgi:hypothetical protein
LVLALATNQLITANFALGSLTNPPAITQQPASRTLGSGADVLLSVQVSGDPPFSYQWRFGGSPIAGGVNSKLALAKVSPAKAGLYDVVVVGSAGAVTSAPASIAVFTLQMAQSADHAVPLLILDAAPGSRYRLEWLTDLAATGWSLLAPVSVPEGRLYYLDTVGTNDLRRFYRAVPP